MKNLCLTLITLLLLPPGGHAFGSMGDMLNSLEDDLGKIGNDLDNVYKNVKEVQPAYKSIEETARQLARDTSEKIVIDVAKLEVHRRSDEIQQHIKMAETKLYAIDIKIEKLKILNHKMESEKAHLKKERDRIAKEKADIENWVKLFSVGFYTFLPIVCVVLLGILGRILNSRLKKIKAIGNRLQKRRATKLRAAT